MESLASSELFDPGLGFSDTLRPVISNINLIPGQMKFSISGSGFRGYSEGSSGSTNSSSTNYPLMLLQRVDNEQSALLLSDPLTPWSDTSFTSQSVPGLLLPSGLYRAMVITNAIPSIELLVGIDSSIVAAPAIVTAPASLNFGNVPIGSTSSSMTATVTNNGSANLVLSSISLTGTGSTQFALASGGTCGTSLAPGGSCQVNITFSPISINSQNASLQILSNDPVNGTYNIPITGVGIIQTYVMTITFAGTGSGVVAVSPAPPGINCSANCSQSFNSGTTVTLLPSANSGSSFAGWGGCDSVNGSTCTDTMNSIKSVTATFNSTLSISTASLPAGTTGTAYNQTLAATGGMTPYTWSVTSGSLPVGISLNASTGAVTGIPTVSGTSSFTVQVTDANNVKITKALSIVINAGTLTITTASLPDSYVSSSYSQTLTASGGSTPFTWSISSGTLPAGLSLNATSGGITGTPTTSGTKTFTVQVKDSGARTATKSLSIAVDAALAISTTSLSAGYVGVAYSQALTGTGGKTPYSWSISSGALPAGLSISASTGAISGTPTTGGNGTFTVQLKDANNVMTTKSFTLTVNPALSISTLTLADGYVGTTYSQTLAATGGKTSYTWTKTSGTIPAGLSLSTAGVISGKPTATGSSSFTVQVKDANSTTATQTLTIVIYAAPVISTASMPAGTTGTAYNQTLVVTGGKTPYTWSITTGSLPTGLSLSSTGVITGTPTATGTSSFTVQAADANSVKATKALSIVTNAGTLTITTASLSDGYVGSAYSQTLTASGGSTPFTWSISTGTLPTGLSLNASTGALTGTPTAIGAQTFTIQVKDSGSRTATKSLSITVYTAMSVTTSSLPDSYIGSAYNQTLTGAGGKTPYSWSISNGALPAGLSINASTGAVTGTATTAGNSSFTVQMKDADNATATKTLSIAVYAPPAVSSTSLSDGYVGLAYSQTLSSSGGKAPYSWAVTTGSLPAGLTLNAATGAITGTPTGTGTSNFIVQLTDANNVTTTKSLSINIYAAPTISTTAIPDGYVSSLYSQTLATTGGKAPYLWSVSSGSLPAGLTLNANTGVISGTPTTTGSSSFTVQSKDSNSIMATRALTITVYAALSINTVTLPDGYTSSAYSQSPAATGGKAPLAWSIITGSLPAGLGINASTGAITGTPTTAGNSSFTVQVMDANSMSATKLLTITVYAPPVISSANLPDGYIGINYNQTPLISGGKYPYGWSITSGTLPSGLAINANTGAITGTPTTAGSSNFTIQIMDANGATASKALAIMVYTPVVIGTSSLIDGYVGGTYSQSISDSGGKPPYNWSIASGNLPAGLNLNASTGILSGTPTATGSSNLTIQVTDANNDTAAKALAITVYSPLVINSAVLSDGYYGGTYNQTISDSGGKAPYSWSITSGSLPTGLTLNASTGAITGSPTTVGNANFTVQVMDANNTTASKSLAMSIYAALSVTTSALPNTFVGDTYNQILTVSGGKSPLSWSIVTGSLPAGLTLAAATGVISGSPSAVGNSSFTVQVTDANLVSATMSLSINVTPPPFTVVNLGDVGDVTIIQVVGNYDAKNADGSVNALPREMIAKEYFKNHSDTVDFLVFLSTFDYATPEVGAMAFYMGVKNDTQGINQPIFDNTALFGSQGILQGTIDLGNVTALAAAPYGPLLDQTLTFHAHEMLHRFAAYINYKNPDGTLNTSLLGKDNVHWSYLLDTQGSVLYGNGWTNNGNGTFTSTSVMSGYSLLDLYLMGMIPKTQVPPMLLISNPAIDPTQLPQLGATISGTATTVSIDDIIAAAGPRVPDSTTSKKTFNFAYVLLTRPGDDTSLAQPAIEILRSAWAGKYTTVTQGIGNIASVPATLNVYIDSSVSGATVTGPDVTVTGAVVNSTGAETGVTVNGVLAAVSGSRFVANHVPLQPGANTISVSATDVNGLTASASCTVTDTPGYYLRIVPNVSSGTAPLNISFSIDSSFIVTNPSMTTSGPASLTLTAASATQYTGTISFEGTYNVTASATGPDGQQYGDTVTFNVLSSNQLSSLLQAKWNGIKASIAANDINGIVSYLPTYLQPEYTSAFTSMGSSNLALLNNYMTPLQFVGIVGDRAKFLTFGTEIIQGQPVQLAFPVYFIQENGIWKLSHF